MTTERERRFLVASRPTGLAAGDAIEQGYLVTGDVAVRVRRTRRPDGSVACRLTVKGGAGRVRTEVEVPIEADQFDALWQLTAGRRLEKVRHRIPLDGHVAELDLFGGALAGLELVEVEFDDDAAMDAFEPPVWFGREVSDDPRWSNAALAERGRPDR